MKKKQETFKYRENGKINAKGRKCLGEVNLGKTKVETQNFMTLTQQINSMLDPMLGQGMHHNEVDTRIPATEKDTTDIDLVGLGANKYKASKHDIVDIGRKANEQIKAEIQNKGRKNSDKAQTS